MSSFFEIRERILKTDKEMQQLGCNLNGEICRNIHNPRPKSNNSQKRNQPKFQSHPKRMSFDSDSNPCVSLGKLRSNLSSSTSNLNFERESCIYEQRKKKAHSFRKKLHEKLSNLSPTYGDVYLDDFGDGDSCRVSPTHFDIHVREIYNIDKTKSEDFKMKETVKSNKSGILKRYSANALKPVAQNVPSTQRTMGSAVFHKKFKAIVEKSCQIINNIRSLIEKGLNIPDGDEDISRRELRVKEFCNRFSRNYLYPLARQISDLNDPTKNLKIGTFNFKLLSTYQTILNGLQAYQNHVPTSIGNCSSDRYKVLLINLLQVCEIQRKYDDTSDDKEVEDFITSFKLNAEITLQKIEDNLNAAMSADSILKSNSTRISLPKFAEGAKEEKKPNKVPKKNAMEKRLSMYAVTASFRKEAPWKKAVESLAEKKFNVKSKYKTSTFKHRPPNQKEGFANVPKLKTLKKSDICKQTPMASPVREENIKTMVQFIENNEGKLKEKQNESLQNNEVITKFLKLIEENKNKAESTQNLMPILEFLQNEKNFEVFSKFVEEMNKKTNNKEKNKLTLEIVNSQSSIPPESDGVKKRKEPKIIQELGEKNARLICIEDENSIVLSEDKDQTNNTPVESKDCQTDVENPTQIAKSTSETQTDVNSNEEKPSKNTQKSLNKIKIARAPKSGRRLKMLPKNYAVPAIQYKLDFYRQCKNNPMYKKTANIQPWLLMGRMSEELLNESLLEVAKEIEVNEIAIANEVFESELRL